MNKVKSEKKYRFKESENGAWFEKYVSEISEMLISGVMRALVA